MTTIPRLLVCLGLAACAATLPRPQPSLVRVDPYGVSPRQRALPSGALLRLVNDDVRPHEIYSNDCRELASTPLAPGQAYVVQLAPGPKVCHFQDLLAPSTPEFWGTVEVAEPPPSDSIS